MVAAPAAAVAVAPARADMDLPSCATIMNSLARLKQLFEQQDRENRATREHSGALRKRLREQELAIQNANRADDEREARRRAQEEQRVAKIAQLEEHLARTERQTQAALRVLREEQAAAISTQLEDITARLARPREWLFPTLAKPITAKAPPSKPKERRPRKASHRVSDRWMMIKCLMAYDKRRSATRRQARTVTTAGNADTVTCGMGNTEAAAKNPTHSTRQG